MKQPLSLFEESFRFYKDQEMKNSFQIGWNKYMAKAKLMFLKCVRDKK